MPRSKPPESPPPLRSFCPVACTLDILGDKWSLIVIRDCVLGKTRYGEFLDSPESIPTNILSERLKRLESHGILLKERYSNHRNRYTYHLSDKGHELAIILEAIADWGLRHIPAAAPSREQLAHFKAQLRHPIKAPQTKPTCKSRLKIGTAK